MAVLFSWSLLASELYICIISELDRAFLLLPLAPILSQRRHLMFDVSELAAATDDDAALAVVGEAVSPHEMRRVGDALGAFDQNCTEQVRVLTAPSEYYKTTVPGASKTIEVD